MIAKAMMALAAVILLGSGPVLAQNQTQDTQQDTQAVLSRLVQDVAAAQRVGTLAADKNLQVDYALLGDQVALTNARITRELDQVIGETGVDVPRTLDEQSQARFEQMRGLIQEDFAREFVAFIDDVYPRIIEGIEALSRQAPENERVAVLVEEAVPALRNHVGAADQLAQAGELDEDVREELNRGPIQRKDDPEIIPDTTAPIGQDSQ